MMTHIFLSDMEIQKALDGCDGGYDGTEDERTQKDEFSLISYLSS